MKNWLKIIFTWWFISPWSKRTFSLILGISLIAILLALIIDTVKYQWSINHPTNLPTTITVGTSLNNSVSSGNPLEDRIKKVLPKGVFLRDYELLPNVSPEDYLVIYIEDYKITPLPDESSGFLFLSCPGEVMGQTIEGVYHLALFQKNSIVNDTVIPPTNPTLLDYGYVYATSTTSSLRQELVYKNFDVSNTTRKVSELVTIKLIDLHDFIGDGQKYEFILASGGTPCGHEQRLIAGYDKNTNSAIVFPIRENNKILYWEDGFFPDAQGKVNWTWPCGDHGADTQQEKSFVFDSIEKDYMLVSASTKLCQ